MDGGVSLLLLGNGDGTFEPVWPDDSGLVVPYDAKSLAVTDVDGDGRTDFVVGVNNQAVEAFTANGEPERRVVNVRLKGAPGNQKAIGAGVSLELSSGMTQTAEVAAGGGYLVAIEPHTHLRPTAEREAVRTVTSPLARRFGIVAF